MGGMGGVRGVRKVVWSVEEGMKYGDGFECGV